MCPDLAEGSNEKKEKKIFVTILKMDNHCSRTR